MKRSLLIFAALLGLSAPALAQTRPLPQGEIRANGDITFGNALRLGKREGNKTVITPDTLQILGEGSTGVISDMRARARNGTIARSFSDRATDMGRNVRDFGAVCDGATDNGPAFRAAFAVARVVRYDLEGCASHYLINTTVTIPPGASLIGPGDGSSYPLGIRTSAAVDGFTVGGDQWSVSNARIQHDGASGMAINGGFASYGTLSRSAIIGNVAGNTSPLVQTGGSLITLDSTTFTNNRVGAYAFTIYGNGTTSPIVLRVSNINLGGPGMGLSVGSAGNVKRPEGIYLTNNHCFLTNTCLVVNSALDIRSVGNTWDIGGGNQVVLAGVGEGIDLASFTDDYFSTLNTAVSPAATNANGVCLQVSGSVSRLTVRSKFAYCGYGIASTDGVSSYLTIGSTFLNVANIALNLQGVKGVTLSGNTCTSCAYNFILADGAAGGPFVLNDNQWDPAGAIGLTRTNAPKFRFGNGNSGVVLAGYSAGATAVPSTGCYTVAIPHGLAGVPDMGRITLTPGVAEGTMSNVTATVAGADGSTISAQVCATVQAAGVVRVTANASL